MNAETRPMTPETRESLGKLRNLLLAQHKVLLERERLSYEAVYGPIPGPGPFLKLVLEAPHFSWLKRISTLVVEIDEALARRSTAGEATGQALTMQAREIMTANTDGDDFQSRYADAVRDSAISAALHARIVEVLRD